MGEALSTFYSKGNLNTMKNVTLYHHGPSTCSQKVRMILELKNISYESKIIDLLAGEQHASEYVKLNAKMQEKNFDRQRLDAKVYFLLYPWR